MTVRIKPGDVGGAKVLDELRALGMTDDEIFHGAPVEVDPEAVYAWLEGRGPCPVDADGAPVPRVCMTRHANPG